MTDRSDRLGRLAGPVSATAPPRGFTAEAWAALPREDRRKLVHALVVEAGASFARVDNRARHDDLLFATAPLLGPRQIRVRVVDGPCTAADLAALADQARRESLAEHLLIGSAADDPALAADDHYLAADEMIELLEASAAVSWTGGVPSADPEAFAAMRGDDTLDIADTLGFRALAPLSRNKLPWAMRVAGVPGAADDWFERVFFRVATAAAGLHGRRFGSAERGQRVADGLLRLPCSTNAALYDCKAARDGYVMTADHERRLIEYAGGTFDHDGTRLTITRVVIVSSAFPGGPPHPFEARQAAFRNAGHDLSDVRAADVVAAVVALRPHLDLDTRHAGRVDWCAALDEGLVTRVALLSAVERAAAA